MTWSRWSIAAVLMAASSLVLGAVALSRGELSLHILLFIPVVSATGGWGAAAMLLAFGAFASLVMHAWRSAASLEAGRDVTSGQGRVSGGAVILLGPIPIVLGSDRRTALLVMAAALVAMALLVLLLL